MDASPITVKQLNTYVKSLIESDVRLLSVAVTGEISNFKNHYSSGHWYFTLKDSDAQIRCVMFKLLNLRVPFDPCDGMKVIIKGRVSIYERDGQYQFYAEEIHSVGEGDLALAFERLKEKLEKEGLFAAEEKRPLKRFPRRIAVLTSDTGAALRDILNITSKRYPICDILIYPVLVQGDSAPKSMINMLEKVYVRDDIDTIIIGRGGGSLEDLWAFNNEELARKIYESPVPVISAVGHETDFTICDFVADVRASTPSHAAELAVPDMKALFDILDTYNKKFSGSLISKYNLASTKYSLAVSSNMFSAPQRYFDDLSLKIDSIEERNANLLKNRLLLFEKSLSEAVSRLDALSPLKTISRGFAAVSANDVRIKNAKELSVGQSINLRFFDGEADCVITELRCENE